MQGAVNGRDIIGRTGGNRGEGMTVGGTREPGFDATPGGAFGARGRAAFHLEAERAAHQPAARRLVMHDEEGGLRLLGEARQPGDDAAGNGRGVVQHDQPEGPAAQEDVGAPRALPVGGRPDDPEEAGRGEGHPVGGGQGARGVDICYGLFVFDGAGDDGVGQGRGPAARWSRDLAQPAAGNAAAGERGIEGRDPGGHRALHRGRRGDDRGQLGPEGGKRGGHEEGRDRGGRERPACGGGGNR